jgi:glutathione S-transferase
MDAPQFTAGVRRFVKLFGDMAQALAYGPWLAGEAITLADIGYAPYVARLDHLGLGWLAARDARVADWAARIRARPSYQTGLAQWFNASSLAAMARTSDAAGRKLQQLLQPA